MSTRTHGLNHEGHTGTKITKKSLWSLFLGGLCVVAVAVASASIQEIPDRSHPPALGPLPALHVPAIEKRKLTNGMEVWVVPMHKVPTVHLQFVSLGGYDPDKPGLANLTAAMLDEGAGTRTSLEIADAIDYLGADLNADSTWDAGIVALHVPVAHLADALPIMADVILRPTFPEAELKRLKAERLASLLQAEDDPEQLIRFAFPRLVYGPTHPFGTSLVGTAASLQSLTVADLRKFYEAHYQPGTSLLIVTGDVAADAILPSLNQAFGAWRPPFSAGRPFEPAAQLTSRHVYLIDKPGAAQSQIRIGWIGVPRSTPDYFAIRVLNTVLGGAFTSRLNNNLREVHGYAYGASSTFDMRRGVGPFYAAAGVQTDKTAEALKEFFNELTGIHEPIPAAELEKAKNYLALQLPRNFETERDVAASLAQLYLYNLPADYYATYADRVRAVTADEVKRAADKYIQPDKFAVVIVGDRKLIEAGVRALNLGPLTIVLATEIMK
jgi:zinc protease